MDRRRFLGGCILVAGLASSRPVFGAVGAPTQRILVLGGTNFLGPAIVEAAVAAGHTVTLFNRGVTNPSLFPNLEKLRGFRGTNQEDQDLAALGHRQFDVAIDVWPHDPAVSVSAAQYLKGRIGHYLYVSSIAAYRSDLLSTPGIDESAPTEPWNSAASFYARGKAESERRLLAIFGDDLTIVRPGPIKGDWDTTPDLLNWLVRAENGGQHIGPGDGTDSVEFVDVKDVARFVVTAIGKSHRGIFNLTGRPIKFREFLDACRRVTNSPVKFVWVPEDFLLRQGLQTDAALHVHGGNFPLWRPADMQPGPYEVSSEKAFRAGWQTRPFDETAFGCLAFFRLTGAIDNWQDYLPPDKERQVLAAWAQHTP